MEPLLREHIDENSLILDIYDNTHINYIYQYYYHGGYNTIITNQIVRIINSYILIFIINFLTNCVDYNGILDFDNTSEDKRISDYIYIENWFPHNIYLIICFILYCIYLLCITLNMIAIIKRTGKIKKFYNNDLQINDSSLKYYTWEQIHSKLSNLKDEYIRLKHNDIYSFSNKICHNNNIIISIIRSDYFTIPDFSKLLEWNFIYCIVDPIQDVVKQATSDYHLMNDNNVITSFVNTMLEPSINEKTNIKDNTKLNNTLGEPYYTPYQKLNSVNTPMNSTVNNSVFEDNNKLDLDYQHLYSLYNKKVVARINLVLIINIIALPFAVIILGIYLILKYGEKFYHNPKLVYQRQLNIKAKWKLKYYNEYPHIHEDRIKLLQHNMDLIIDQYKSTIFQVIYRLFIFICGSIFIVLFSLTLISGNEFANIILFDNKSILWFLSILGTFLIVARSNKDTKFISKKERGVIFDKLKKNLISIDKRIINDETDKETMINLIKDIYPYKVKFILYELIYLFLAPYYLLKWKKELKTNYRDIMALLDSDMDLGAVAKYSVFNNNMLIDKDVHMLLSLVNFSKNFNYSFDYDNLNDILMNTYNNIDLNDLRETLI